LDETNGQQQTLPSSDDASAQLPRDAATLIIVDDSTLVSRVLMGKRRSDQVFMPGKYVFPGGRVDVDDDKIESFDELAEEEVLKLQQGMRGPVCHSRARALALAGIREVFEETGKVIGRRTDRVSYTRSPGWRGFFASGHQPVLSDLRFFGRAVTPLGRPRRYDTRFFCVPARSIAVDTEQRDHELTEIDWYTIDETFQLDLPLITRAVLEDLSQQLATGEVFGASQQPAHLYYLQDGAFVSEPIDIS